MFLTGNWQGNCRTEVSFHTFVYVSSAFIFPACNILSEGHYAGYFVEYACRSKATVPHVPFSEPPVRAEAQRIKN